MCEGRKTKDEKENRVKGGKEGKDGERKEKRLLFVTWNVKKKKKGGRRENGTKRI